MCEQRLTLTHSAADAEQKRGFLRLYVDHARAEQDKFEVVIAQSLTMGQFCLDSAKKPSNYEQLFPQRSRRRSRRATTATMRTPTCKEPSEQ